MKEFVGLRAKTWAYLFDDDTEQINKIALSSDDDQRLQTFDKITTYPYGINAFKVWKNEMLSKI